MKRILVVMVLSAVLVAGGVFAFAGVSRAADNSLAAGTAVRFGQGGLFMDTVAKLVGLDSTTIMTRRQNGESLVAIAASQGVGEQQLIDAVKTEHVTRINEYVATKRLTQAQADTCIAGLDSTIKASVERTTVGPSGADCLGLGRGAGRGAGRGTGIGRGAGNGRGIGSGRGCGSGR